ncbi:hypothetical protein SAMN02927903_01096 [Flavobacterium caeni]|uniref:Uncharacterized protein n=1 Tax=Flavobacterium caeni TaxID=490189 RepID=A0A1G5EMP5_9FLAO|nr:hypothetical protein SAMN02927903_01096 [Flavobacterium caeni]
MTQIKLSEAERKALILKIIRYMNVNPAYREHVEKTLLKRTYHRFSNESQA